MSEHYKYPTNLVVYYKADLVIISLQINLFSPWYSWKIAELALNNKYLLTLIYIYWNTICHNQFYFYLWKDGNKVTGNVGRTSFVVPSLVTGGLEFYACPSVPTYVLLMKNKFENTKGVIKSLNQIIEIYTQGQEPYFLPRFTPPKKKNFLTKIM